MAWNVLILGGGFGGLCAARKLEPRHVVVPLREHLSRTAPAANAPETAAEPMVPR